MRVPVVKISEATDNDTVGISVGSDVGTREGRVDGGGDGTIEGRGVGDADEGRADGAAVG